MKRTCCKNARFSVKTWRILAGVGVILKRDIYTFKRMIEYIGEKIGNGSIFILPNIKITAVNYLKQTAWRTRCCEWRTRRGKCFRRRATRPPRPSRYVRPELCDVCYLVNASAYIGRYDMDVDVPLIVDQSEPANKVFALLVDQLSPIFIEPTCTGSYTGRRFLCFWHLLVTYWLHWTAIFLYLHTAAFALE